MKCPLLFALFAISYCSLFAQHISGDHSYKSDSLFLPDIEPSYPGGMNEMFAFFQKNAIYPKDALVNDIEGIVITEFIIDKHGIVVPSSVKIIKSLLPSCDNEAIRVIKLFPKWLPAIKNDTAISSKLVIPFTFKLLDNTESPKFAAYKIVYPLKALIQPKPIVSASPNWSLYFGSELDSLVGKVSPGDTISVINWDYKTYQIQTKKHTGFISSMALKPNKGLDSLAKYVDKYKNINLKRKQATKQYTALPKAHLSVTSAKRSIYVNECTTISVSLNVSSRNTIPVQFMDLNSEIPIMLKTKLNINYCWSSKKPIEEITGEDIQIGTERYKSYQLCELAYCPYKAQDIHITPLSLNLKRIQNSGRNIYDTVNFLSKALTINVKPMPAGIKTTSSDYFAMVGQFTFKDTILSEKVILEKPLLYKITLHGKGLTFPITPPKILMPNTTYTLVDIVSSDTIINHVYFSTRSYSYYITFHGEGYFNFSDNESLKFFDPSTTKLVMLKSKQVVFVTKENNEVNNQVISFNAFQNMILIDVSQSMLIEDYASNRLKTATQALAQFLPQRKACDIGLVTFSGDAKVHATHTADSCYVIEKIKAIAIGIKPGTSIGDAIWYSKQFMSLNGSSKIVIISDGDNTSGITGLTTALAIAKKYHIKIYTIGVGGSGQVLTGFGTMGEAQICSDSFDAKMLKNIALQTGGQYYKANSQEHINTILHSIFQ